MAGHGSATGKEPDHCKGKRGPDVPVASRHPPGTLPGSSGTAYDAGMVGMEARNPPLLLTVLTAVAAEATGLSLIRTAAMLPAVLSLAVAGPACRMVAGR